MPIIRRELHDFVETWNAHPIRAQPNRKHVVPGVPHDLFMNPDELAGFVECKAPLDEERWAELMQYIQTDVDAYLPAQTMATCDEILAEIGGFPETMPAYSVREPWLEQYIYLRDRLYTWEQTEAEPPLEEFAKPRRTKDHLEKTCRDLGINVSGLNGMESDDEADDRD